MPARWAPFAAARAGVVQTVARAGRRGAAGPPGSSPAPPGARRVVGIGLEDDAASGREAARRRARAARRARRPISRVAAARMALSQRSPTSRRRAGAAAHVRRRGPRNHPRRARGADRSRRRRGGLVFHAPAGRTPRRLPAGAAPWRSIATLGHARLQSCRSARGRVEPRGPVANFALRASFAGGSAARWTRRGVLAFGGPLGAPAF